MGAKVEAGRDATDGGLAQVVVVEMVKYPLCGFSEITDFLCVCQERVLPKVNFFPYDTLSILDLCIVPVCLVWWWSHIGVWSVYLNIERKVNYE